jgi:hypothetical protein
MGLVHCANRWRYSLIGQLILVYLAGSAMDSLYLPASLMLVTFWAIAMAISAKAVFSAKK